MQALCGLQGIFDLFNCKTPVHVGILAEEHLCRRIIFEISHADLLLI